MELNFKIKTDEGTKDNSKHSFLKHCIAIIFGICFIVYCFTSNGYNFDIKIEKEKAVIQGYYNSSTQN